MRSKVILALVLLNVMLLVSLCFHNVFTQPAHAQLAPRPSTYLMVPGEIQGANSGVIFIIDTRNNWLTVRTFDGTAFADMPPIELDRFFGNKK